MACALGFPELASHNAFIKDLDELVPPVIDSEWNVRIDVPVTF